jgi:hypothetical protein
MTLDEAKLYLDNEINQISNNGRTKTYIMNLAIDNNEGNVIESITKYLNSKQIAVDIHLCKVRNTFDLIIWW